MMVPVYDAPNVIEAHMIKHLLEGADIRAEVDGDHLQVAMGELPAMGLIRVMVEDVDAEKARRVIKQWDANRPKLQESEPEHKKSTLSQVTFGFILGALLTGAIAFFINRSPLSVAGADFNFDGFLDQKNTYRNHRQTKLEVDRNMDKTYDIVYDFDTKGLVILSNQDEDFDGLFDTQVVYSRNLIALYKSDTNQDGFYDYVKEMKNGVIQKVRFYDSKTKQIKKVDHYRHIKKAWSELDSNDDGILDTKIVYDEFEEVVSKEAF